MTTLIDKRKYKSVERYVSGTDGKPKKGNELVWNLVDAVKELEKRL